MHKNYVPSGDRNRVMNSSIGRRVLSGAASKGQGPYAKLNQAVASTTKAEIERMREGSKTRSRYSASTLKQHRQSLKIYEQFSTMMERPQFPLDAGNVAEFSGWMLRKGYAKSTVADQVIPALKREHNNRKLPALTDEQSGIIRKGVVDSVNEINDMDSDDGREYYDSDDDNDNDNDNADSDDGFDDEPAVVVRPRLRRARHAFMLQDVERCVDSCPSGWAKKSLMASLFLVAVSGGLRAKSSAGVRLKDVLSCERYGSGEGVRVRVRVTNRNHGDPFGTILENLL
jgi:hypothetical protein